MNDVFVRLVPLPSSVKGFVKEDADGNYNVYIREQDPREVQAATYAHELAHIRGHHLQSAEWSERMEEEAEHGQQGKENARGDVAGSCL